MKVPILLPNIFNHPFTYDSDLKLKIGDYVLVPFGKANMTGVVWDHFEKQNQKIYNLKKVIKKFNVLSLNINTIKFLNWFSEYNLIPKGMSLKLHLLSNEAIENLPNIDYTNYNLVKKSLKFPLSTEQEKSLKE